MKFKIHVLLIFTLSTVGLIGFGSPALAETRVSGDELKRLLSGNTAEGRYIKWETTHKMYFEATGKLRRIDSLNNQESGDWYVNKDGELCISVRKELCNEVMQRDDGGYNVYRRGDLKFTFDKIVPDNPHNL